MARIGMSRRLLAAAALTLSFAPAADAAESEARLVEAVRTRDGNAVRALLAQRVDVNQPQADGTTALAWAAHLDDMGTAQALLRAGANADAANEYGVTPLSLACLNGSTAMVQLLLKAGADPNVLEWTGVTPLMTCARSGQVETIRALLAQKADVNAADRRRGQTALMWAAAARHPAVVKLLIDAGADVNAESKKLGGFQPRRFLTYGIYRREPGGPDTFGPEDVHEEPAASKGGFTALMFAAQQGDVESARLLIEAGANVNHAAPDYGSALIIATASGHEAVALLLVEKGADPDVADWYGFYPLHYALQEGITAIGMSRERMPTDADWLRPNMPAVVKALLARGANPNVRVGRGFPPFDHAPFARTTGNSMPQVRQPGATPFLLAAASLDVELMRALVAHGADPLIATNEGTTPLMVAAGVGRLEDFTPEEFDRSLAAVKLAVELGNDVNAANDDGRTALAGAAFVGADHVIEFLAQHGVDLNAKDRYGQTALSIARGMSPRIPGGDKRFHTPKPHETTAALLLKLGAAPVPARGTSAR